MEFHERLKFLRKEHHLTQAKLAEKLAYGSTAIANYESGRNQPSFSDLKKIAAIFQVSLDYLLGLSENRLPYPLIDDSEEFQQFFQCFSVLNEESKRLSLSYMQWLAERQEKPNSNPYEEQTNRRSTALKVAQKPEDFSY